MNLRENEMLCDFARAEVVKKGISYRKSSMSDVSILHHYITIPRIEEFFT